MNLGYRIEDGRFEYRETDIPEDWDIILIEESSLNPFMIKSEDIYYLIQVDLYGNIRSQDCLTLVTCSERKPKTIQDFNLIYINGRTTVYVVYGRLNRLIYYKYPFDKYSDFPYHVYYDGWFTFYVRDGQRIRTGNGKVLHSQDPNIVELISEVPVVYPALVHTPVGISLYEAQNGKRLNLHFILIPVRPNNQVIFISPMEDSLRLRFTRALENRARNYRRLPEKLYRRFFW